MKINPFRNQTTERKSQYIISKNVDASIMRKIRAHREIGADLAVDHIHVDNKIQEVKNNHNETQTSILRNNVTNVVINSEKTAYNRAPQRTKFVRNVQNGDTSPKYAVQETSIIWGTAMMRNNRGKLRRRVKKRTTIQKHLPNLHQIMVGMNTKLISFRYWQIRKLSKLKNTANVSEDGLSGHIDKFKTKTEELFAIADSGNPLSFLNEKTARRLQEIHKSSFF